MHEAKEKKTNHGWKKPTSAIIFIHFAFIIKEIIVCYANAR